MVTTQSTEMIRSQLRAMYFCFACIAMASIGINIWPQFQNILWPSFAVLGLFVMIFATVRFIRQFKKPAESELEQTVLYQESRSQPLVRFSILDDVLFIRSVPGPIVLEEIIPFSEITAYEVQRKWLRPYLRISGLTNGITWKRELLVKSPQKVLDIFSTQVL